jgi:hypothetical protein
MLLSADCIVDGGICGAIVVGIAVVKVVLIKNERILSRSGLLNSKLGADVVRVEVVLVDGIAEPLSC